MSKFLSNRNNPKPKSSNVNYNATYEHHANLNYLIKISKGLDIINSVGYLQFRVKGTETVNTQHYCYDFKATEKRNSLSIMSGLSFNSNKIKLISQFGYFRILNRDYETSIIENTYEEKMSIIITSSGETTNNILFYRLGITYIIMRITNNKLWIGFNYIDAIQKLEHRSIGLSIGVDL